MKKFSTLLITIVCLLNILFPISVFAADFTLLTLQDETVVKDRPALYMEAKEFDGYWNLYSYHWYRVDDTNYANPQLIAETLRFVPPTDAEGTFYFYCEVTEKADVSNTDNTNVMTLTVTAPDHVLTDGDELNLDDIQPGASINVSGNVKIFEDEFGQYNEIYTTIFCEEGTHITIENLCIKDGDESPVYFASDGDYNSPPVASTLTIKGYNQLKANVSCFTSASNNNHSAGIRSGADVALNINGDGEILVYGGPGGGAGIGGGEYEGCGTLTISGTPTIRAIGNSGAAGIGGGSHGVSGTINIDGGTINARGGMGRSGYPLRSGAGIGSGYDSESAMNVFTINISAGDITGLGGYAAAGIGSGYDGNCKYINITGGTINASSAYKADAIGLGDNSDSYWAYINITGGDITADCSDNGAGIAGSNTVLTIGGDAVVRATGESASGIGGGNTPIVITGNSIVYANGVDDISTVANVGYTLNGSAVVFYKNNTHSNVLTTSHTKHTTILPEIINNYGPLPVSWNGTAGAVHYREVADTPTISNTQPVTIQCESGDIRSTSVSAEVADGGILSYQWYENVTESTVGGTILTNENDETLVVPTDQAGTTVYYYCVVTNTNNRAITTQTATATSPITTVIVEALPVDAEAPIFTTHPEDKTIIEGDTITLSVDAYVTDGGTLSYLWYQCNADNSTRLSLTGETSPTLTRVLTRDGTNYYYCRVRNTNNAVGGTKYAYSESNIATVIIEEPVDAEQPTITTRPSNIRCYIGDIETMSVVAEVSDGGTLSYQWYENVSTNSLTWELIDGATSATFIIPTDSIHTTYYRCRVTNTNNSATGDVTSYKDSYYAWAYVQAIPVSGVTLDQNTMILTVDGATGTLTETVAPTNATDKSVTWSSDNPTVATVVDGVVTPLAIGNAIITVRTNDNDRRDYCTVTVEAEPLTGTVTITGNLKFDEELTATVTSTNNTGILSYQWKRDDVDIASATSQTYTTVEADISTTLSVEVTSSVETGSITGTATGAIDKADQAAPSTPTLDTKTHNSITLVEETGCEYAIDGGVWQTSTTLSQLQSETAYDLVQRYAETSTHNASAASEVLEVTTDAEPINALTGTVSISGTLQYTEQLTADVSSTNNTGTLSYQWKRDDVDIASATSQTYTTVEADISTTLSVEVTSSVETGSITGTATGAIDKADQAAPSTPTLDTKTHNSITLVEETGCEYAIDGGVWQTSFGFTGLDADTEYSLTQRLIETSTHNASPASEELSVTTNASTTVPTNVSIENQVIGGTGCYGATQTIVVAEDGNEVRFQNASNTNLIAGQSVRFLPGTVIEPGANLHAWITDDNTFCDALPESIVRVQEPEEKSREIIPEKEDENELQTLKVYPNPSDGRFTIEIRGYEEGNDVLVYNSMGQLVREFRVWNKGEVELFDVRKGIYLVKVKNSNLFQRIVIR